ncbi:MAG: hypothetical protein K2X07_09270 [Caulobacteraceae bacterium]|nr:hypothetical protein [Caulobacteraceae bacterium]
MMGSVTRARTLVVRSGGWLDETPGGYALRLGSDRRARVHLTIDEAAFRELIADPGLRVRPGGGWTARSGPKPTAGKAAGQPGAVEGDVEVMETDGRSRRRRANLTPTAIAWLATRRDAEGRPWLSPAERAAGERLTRDAEMAQAGPSLTLRWDALPRSGSGSAARFEPEDHAHRAGRRVEAALTAVDPRLRPLVEAVCVRGSALQAAEGQLGLRRRGARDLLKVGLQALARHYGIG